MPSAWLVTGYTRQFELYYNQPYADNALKHGFGFKFSAAQLREVEAQPHPAGHRPGYEPLWLCL